MTARMLEVMLRRNIAGFCFALALWTCTLAAQTGAAPAAPGIWKVAPPPPASWKRDRLADLTARRHAAMDRIGDHGVLILNAAEPRNYANDVDWPFRQENDFFYLTGLTQPGATLVLVPGGGKIREMIFLPKPDPFRETWTGHMTTMAEAREISGIQDVFDQGEFNSLLFTLIPRARAALSVSGDPAGHGGRAGRGGAGPRGGDDTAPAAGGMHWRNEFQKPMAYADKQELELYMILPVRHK